MDKYKENQGQNGHEEKRYISKIKRSILLKRVANKMGSKHLVTNRDTFSVFAVIFYLGKDTKFALQNVQKNTFIYTVTKNYDIHIKIVILVT